MTKPMLKFDGHLVGMHFRPPAKDIVNMLPAGAELLAVRQPDNPHDVNAISVVLPGWCKGGQHDALFQQISEQLTEPCTTDEERAEALAVMVDPMPLGYICNGEKTGGKKADTIAPQMDGAGITNIPCKLTFDEKGKPMVVIESDFTPHEHKADVGTDTQDTSVNTDVI